MSDNPGYLWTEDELDALPLYGSHAQWVEATGSIKTSSAWSSRRKRDGISGATPAAVYGLPPRDPDVDIKAFYESVVAHTESKIAIADRPTVLHWSAPDDNWVGLSFIGDIHIGGLIDYRRLERDLLVVEETDGLYAVGMGDYADRFEHSGKIQHAMSGDSVPGSDDQEMLVRYILGRCSKWIAILAGNHDDWGSGAVTVRLAEHLRSTHVSQAGCSLRLSCGLEQYTLYLKHQYGGSSRNNSSNEGRRLWSEWDDFINADATVVAHLHQPDTHQVQKKGQSVIHLRGGTYKLIDPWARKGGYIPAYGPGILIFNPRTHEVIPFDGTLWHWGVAMLKALRSGTFALPFISEYTAG